MQRRFGGQRLKAYAENVAYERGLKAHGNIPRRIGDRKMSPTNDLKYMGGDRRRERMARDPLAKGVAAGRPVRNGSGIRQGGKLKEKANTGLAAGSQIRESSGMNKRLGGIQGGTRSTGGMRSSSGMR